MVQKVRSLGLSGIDGFDVSVEASVSVGLPAFEVVGLPDASVKEARERVRSAIKNCGLRFPASRVTLNLAPADRKKIGSMYDLPIFLAVAAVTESVQPLSGDCAFLGELSLSGDVRPVSGVLSMALRAGDTGIKKLFVPKLNAAEAAFAGTCEVYPVAHVRELLDHLAGVAPIEPESMPEAVSKAYYGVDFSEVRGQENVKRALTVAAAGNHNVLMIGPPGAGKSMLSKRLPTILPDMSRAEILETTAVYSVAGRTIGRGISAERPFRSPHHSLSYVAMAGGGPLLQPGEISLAHNGVLFLDELPEFRRDSLEALRQPLEDGVVTISRAAGTAKYPSRFMLVCAMNPCKCGWYGHPSGRCTCPEQSVQKYRAKVSGPLLDRIDIHIEVPALEFEELRGKSASESSAEIRERVNAAREIQRRRYSGSGIASNSQISSSVLRSFCELDDKCEALLKTAFDRLGLTARSYDRILRVARTIADLEGAEKIAQKHVAEAIQYRSYEFDRK